MFCLYLSSQISCRNEFVLQTHLWNMSQLSSIFVARETKQKLRCILFWTLFQRFYKFRKCQQNICRHVCWHICRPNSCNYLFLFLRIFKKEKNFIPQDVELNKDKLGLCWAKLSCQLGFDWIVINSCCLILINMKWLVT